MTISTPNFTNKVCNSEFVPEVSVSMLKETIALVQSHVFNTRKESRSSGKIYIELKYKTLQFFLQKVLEPLPFRYCGNCISFANLVAEIHLKFLYEIVENHVFVNMLLCSDITEVH